MCLVQNNHLIMAFGMSGIILIVIIVALIYWLRFRSFTKMLEMLHREVPSDIHEIRIQVWISNDQHHRRWAKIIPGTEIGFMVLTSEWITVHSINLQKERIKRRISRSQLRHEWIGSQSVKDANLHWFALFTNGSRLLFSAFTGMNALPSRPQTAEIYRNIVGQHVQFDGVQEFALEKNPGSLVAMILMGLLFVYAVADGFFLNPLEYVDGHPKNLSLSITLTTIGISLFHLAAYQLIRRYSVPARESMVLTMFLGVALMMAVIPGAKRIDTALAEKPMQHYSYHMVREGIFEPDRQGLPKLTLQLRCDYWKQFEKDHTHTFPLQHGGLGFWQFDGRALDRRIAQYLRENPHQ